ncbi:MAG: hypothetical protein RR482_08835 [Clostridia bacterium]
MKQIFTDASLVILSVLYLFEVNYRAPTVWNWMGFLIVLAALVPVGVRMVHGCMKAMEKHKTRQAARLAKKAKRQA